MSWQVNKYGSQRYAFLNVVTCLFQIYEFIAQQFFL